MNERVRPELWPHSELPVRELVARNTGNIILVDGDYDGEYLAQFVWRELKSGHVFTADRVGDKHTRYLSKLAHGPVKPGHVLTFVNRNPLDCRSVNIVELTQSQVAARRPIGSGVKSGVKGDGFGGSGYVGVHMYQRIITGDTIYYSKVKHKLGPMRSSAIQAARDYDKAAVEAWGEWAQLNFPKDFPGGDYPK